MFVSRSSRSLDRPQLRDLRRGDGQVVLRLEVDRAGVLVVQFVELRADLAPDARFLRRCTRSAAGRGVPAGACGTGRTTPSAARCILVVARRGGPVRVPVRSRRAASPSSGRRWPCRIRQGCSASFMANGSPWERREEYSYSIVRAHDGAIAASRNGNRPVRLPIHRIIVAGPDRLAESCHESRLLRDDRNAGRDQGRRPADAGAESRAKCG